MPTGRMIAGLRSVPSNPVKASKVSRVNPNRATTAPGRRVNSVKNNVILMEGTRKGRKNTKGEPKGPPAILPSHPMRIPDRPLSVQPHRKDKVNLRKTGTSPGPRMAMLP